MADAPPPPSVGQAKGQSRIGHYRARYDAFKATNTAKGLSFLLKYRTTFLLLVGSGFAYYRWQRFKQHIRERDTVPAHTILSWKIYPGGIVEAVSASSLIPLMAQSDTGTPDEPRRIMSLVEVVRTLKLAEADERVKGIFADFSSTSIPQVPAYSLGLAQIEEISQAFYALKAAKAASMGEGQFRTVAFTDTFEDQSTYLFATMFDEIYTQPSGSIPLVGLSSSIPFYKRILSWAGIKFQKQARKEYKSMVAPYTEESLTEPQTANQLELLTGLNDNFLAQLASNRFGHLGPATGLEKARNLAAQGPFSATEAVNEGLITGTTYKRHVIDSMLYPQAGVEALAEVEAGAGEQAVIELVGAKGVGVEEERERAREMTRVGVVDGVVTQAQAAQEGSEVEKVGEEEEVEQPEYKFMGFYHYGKVWEQTLSEKKHDNMVVDVGIIYLLGTIGDNGEFGTAAVVKGLKEAAEDDDLAAVVLRIDSGGGGVVESDTIWDAVRACQDAGKVVVASFGNYAASGGYLVATDADAIVAAPSTVTGSIGVAALRPVVTPSLLEKIKITMQSFFTTGNTSQSIFHELEGDSWRRFGEHIDETYLDFKMRVSNGREMDLDLVDCVAGGRVLTGTQAMELVSNYKLDPQPEPLMASGRPTPKAFSIMIGDDLKKALRLAGHTDLSAEKEPEEKARIDDEGYAAGGDAQEGGGEANGEGVVRLDEDQETSPYAPPQHVDQPAEGASSTPASTSASAALEVINNVTALLGGSGDASATAGAEAEAEAEAEAQSYDFPRYWGPFGRGLVDGLGSTRDAATLGIQLLIGRAIQEAAEEAALAATPQIEEATKQAAASGVDMEIEVEVEVDRDEVMKKILPGKDYKIDENGGLSLACDIRFRRYPAEVSFLQGLVDAVRRGDSMEESAARAWAHAKIGLAGWMARSIVRLCADELEAAGGSGLADVSRSLGLGAAGRARWQTRAEVPRVSIR